MVGAMRVCFRALVAPMVVPLYRFVPGGLHFSWASIQRTCCWMGYRQAKSSRGKGTCEMAIPRAKLDILGLPQLIDELTREGAQ